MDIASKIVIVIMLFILVFLVGGIFLQIFFSKRESRWPGLVLPLLSFLYSLVLALNVTAVGGEFPWGPLLASLALGNIPTVILLAIYAACREKRKKRDEIDKMQIEDL
ncbi:hypothetical protein [uncultured Dysosmobacter sp.]|uniref:hypothetical protein n=1 Tax=uncultured Dysosmobacter sp. TaxID=2591384 RepID=UPI00260BDFB0|nr:hypothetical protein [uncultured Dysosmobacter sp.]